MHETEYEHDICNPLDNVSKNADIDFCEKQTCTDNHTWVVTLKDRRWFLTSLVRYLYYQTTNNKYNLLSKNAMYSKLPFRWRLFQWKPCLRQQQNVKPHSASFKTAWLSCKRVWMLNWFVCSPDLKAWRLKVIWHIMKQKIRQRPHY